MADHAIVSPSAAERWFNCPPSARMEERVPQKTNSYSEEGDLAHKLGALKIKWFLVKDFSSHEYHNTFGDIKFNKYYSKEMYTFVDSYVDFCYKVFKSAQRIDEAAAFFVESKFKLTSYIPEGFGTMDFSCVYGDTLHVIDLKFGAGVYVNAENNKQLMIYALGMYDKLKRMYDLKNVLLTIHQPRMDNITTFKMSIKDLLKWGKEELKPAAEIAFAGEGVHKAGDHCRFCDARVQCRELAKYNDELAAYEFRDPELLSDAELAKVVLSVGKLKTWAEAVEKYAIEKAIKYDSPLPGTKIVAGSKGKRTFVNKDEVLSKLKSMGVNESYYTTLAPLTEIEKKLGKASFEENFNSLITRPDGKPKLVDISDERPHYDRNKAAAEVFADIYEED